MARFQINEVEFGDEIVSIHSNGGCCTTFIRCNDVQDGSVSFDILDQKQTPYIERTPGESDTLLGVSKETFEQIKSMI